MRRSEILVLLVACLMFAIGMPSKNDRTPELVVNTEEQQREEASPMDEEFSEMAEDESFKVTFKTRSQEEMKLADALWLRKAAQVAMDAGIPYFNVEQKKIRKVGGQSVVEGHIRLDNDPMLSDYDAQAILDLSEAWSSETP